MVTNLWGRVQVHDMLKMSAGLGFTGQNLSIHEANSIILACRLEFKSIQIQSRPEQGPGVNSNAEEVEAGNKVLMLGWHPPQPQCHRSCWDTCLDHLPLGRPSLPAFACDTRPEPISATWKNSSQENEQMLCIAYFRKKMYRWQYLHSIPKTRPLNYDHVTAGGLHFPYCLNSFAKEWDRNPNPDHYIKTLLYEFSNMNILACNQNTKSSSWGCGAWLPAHWSPTSWSCPSEQPWHPHPHRQRIFACLPSW